MTRKQAARYIGLKLLEGVGLGIVLYVPWVSDRNISGLTWSVACSIITSFGIGFLCEEF